MAKQLTCVEATFKAGECLEEIEQLTKAADLRFVWPGRDVFPNAAAKFRKRLKALCAAFEELVSLYKPARDELYAARCRLPHHKPDVAGYQEVGPFALDVAYLAAKKVIGHAMLACPADAQLTPALLGVFTDLTKDWCTPDEHKRVHARLDSDMREATEILREEAGSDAFGVVVTGRDSPRYEFRKDGAHYRVRFEGESGAIPSDLLGAGYIAALLQQPNKAVSATALRGGVESSDTGRSDHKDNQEAKRNYEKKLRELQTDRERAEINDDPLVIAEVDDEAQKITSEIKKLKGFGGRARHPNDADRVSVRSSIETVKKSCREKWGLPRFANHLDTCLDTGRDCSYRPSNPAPDWNF